MDYKEYSRLRSIARKRIERASAKGLMPYTYLPSVAEIKKTDDPESYLSQIERFLESPGSGITGIKAGAAPFKLELEPAPRVAKLTEEEKKARRRESKRRSAARSAVRKAASDEKQERKFVGYLKALENVREKWAAQGIDLANFIGTQSPAKAKQFVAYMEYRFSQADYKRRYTMQTFIEDYAIMRRREITTNEIGQDFESFLADQRKLKKDKDETSKYGVTIDYLNKVWKKFVNKRKGKQ